MKTMPKQTPPYEQTPPPDPRRVFVVDDHAVVREGLAFLMNVQPDLVMCGEAAGAPAAFSAILKLRPDAVIIDLTLREGNGLELIKQVKASLPHTVILVLTMHEEQQFAERTMRAGASGFISKSEAIEKVIEALRIVLDGGVYITSGIAENLLTETFKTGKTGGSLDPVSRLSDRELQVFELLGGWKGTREIAGALNLSIKTIEYYRQTIREKLDLKTGTDLVKSATAWVKQRDEIDGEPA